jgi:hypothetical protein
MGCFPVLLERGLDAKGGDAALGQRGAEGVAVVAAPTTKHNCLTKNPHSRREVTSNAFPRNF